MLINKMKRKSKFSRQLLSAMKMVEDYEAVGHQFKSDNRHHFFDLIFRGELEKNFIVRRGWPLFGVTPAILQFRTSQ